MTGHVVHLLQAGVFKHCALHFVSQSGLETTIAEVNVHHKPGLRLPHALLLIGHADNFVHRRLFMILANPHSLPSTGLLAGKVWRQQPLQGVIWRRTSLPAGHRRGFGQPAAPAACPIRQGAPEGPHASSVRLSDGKRPHDAPALMRLGTALMTFINSGWCLAVFAH